MRSGCMLVLLLAAAEEVVVVVVQFDAIPVVEDYSGRIVEDGLENLEKAACLHLFDLWP
jgi:hypothetical protein